MFSALSAEAGPLYPTLKGAEKFRKIARRDGGILGMEGADILAYGKAVLTDILRLQRTEIMREAPPVSNLCYASGTAYSDGADILSAIRRRHKSACAVRSTRSDYETRAAYDELMAIKRAALPKISAPARK